MIDAHGRRINYLRVSVTDRCNLRCVYCMPPEGVPMLRHEDLLTFEEIARIVRVGASLGIGKVRLTGGEPLVRRGIVELTQSLCAIPGVGQVAITTNGILLPEYAHPLKAVGLRGVNISLDTLRPDRYRAITRGGAIERAYAGIEAALREGFRPVKINMVVMRGINDDEIQDFARLTMDRPLEVRFIEFMAIGRLGLVDRDRLVPAETILREMGKAGRLDPVGRLGASDPAEVYHLEGAQGALGVVAPVSSPFCRRCNRLRLTSEGKLRSCLVEGGEVDVRALLRGGGGDAEIAEAFRKAAAGKPMAYSCCVPAKMSRIGG